MCWIGTNNTIIIHYGSRKGSVGSVTLLLVTLTFSSRPLQRAQTAAKQRGAEQSDVQCVSPNALESLGFSSTWTHLESQQEVKWEREAHESLL